MRVNSTKRKKFSPMNISKFLYTDWIQRVFRLFQLPTAYANHNTNAHNERNKQRKEREQKIKQNEMKWNEIKQ